MLVMLVRSYCCLCWACNLYENFKFGINHIQFSHQSSVFCVACHVSEGSYMFYFTISNIFEVLKGLV
jgi:hypothetical protein